MRPSRFYIGLFLLTGCTLMLEIIQTRLLSVVAWYHLAFFVISAAMFGMTAGAVWVYLRRTRYTVETLSNDLATSSGYMAIATTLSLLVQSVLNPLLVLSVSGATLYLMLTLLIATPFFYSGIAVSLALTRSPFPIGKVYAVDMAGAATGCLGVLALLELVDGPSAILLSAAGVAVAAALFREPAATRVALPSRFARFVVNQSLLLAVLIAGAGVLNGMTNRGVQPMFIKGLKENPSDYGYLKWNSFSRIAVGRPRTLSVEDAEGFRPMRLWGPSPTLSSIKVPPIESLPLVIDGAAGTNMYQFKGDLRDIEFLKYDVPNLAYFIRNQGRSAVIGVGAGRDVLSAWLFGFRDITGVEINPIIIRVLTKEPFYAAFCGLNELPGVRLIVDEGRSWFVRSREKFDLIQMSLIDTYAATGAGAFTLTENGLYTVEAWTAFFNRLNDRGVFTVSRWFAPGHTDETGRMVSLAAAALMDRGVKRPSDHMFVATSDAVGTLIVSPSPLSAEDVQTLRAKCKELQYEILVSPDQEPDGAVLRGILNSTDRESLYAFTSGLELNMTPSTDENPFFFNLLPFGSPAKMARVYKDTVQRSGKTGAGVATGNLQATVVLLTILAVAAFLVLLTIILPLLSTARGLGGKLIFGGTAYFALLGLGFMFVEIGLLQRLSVFLGHPVYSLSVVLFSLILATGAGSFCSGKAPLHNPGRFALWSLLLGAYVLTMPYWLVPLMAACDEYSILTKSLVSIAVIAPAGLMMGYGFPTGIRLVEGVNAAPTPWFWGINGATGVLASVLAVIISIAYGIRITILLGGIAYLALIPFALLIGFSNRLTNPGRN